MPIGKKFSTNLVKQIWAITYFTSVLHLTLLVHFILIQNIFGQTKSESSLYTYEVLIKDTSDKSEIVKPDLAALTGPMSELSDIKNCIILSSKNKPINNLDEFKTCYTSIDSVKFKDEKGNIKDVLLGLNYLNTSEYFSIKFYERWTIDEKTLEIKKEFLAYSVFADIDRFDNFLKSLLFTVFKDQNSLNYLNSRGYFK